MDNCIHCMLYSGTHLKKISGPARQVSSEMKKKHFWHRFYNDFSKITNFQPISLLSVILLEKNKIKTTVSLAIHSTIIGAALLEIFFNTDSTN